MDRAAEMQLIEEQITECERRLSELGANA